VGGRVVRLRHPRRRVVHRHPAAGHATCARRDNPTARPFEADRAENFDAYSGVQLVDESKARGTAVGAVAAGNWVKYADAALGAKATTFTANVAKATAGTGAIQIRLDSPGGPLVGTATVASTGDVYAYATATAALTGAKGTHDLYLVFGSDLRLSTFAVQ
jgi:beta-glucosidase